MHNLSKLTYSYDSLEPYIDAQTMEIHHSKHHQAYIDKYNAAVSGSGFELRRVYEVLADLNNVPDDIKSAVRNNGGGHLNHSLFWKTIAPKGSNTPSGELNAAINQYFGDLDAFKSTFDTAATTRFGSGWAWLSVDSNGQLLVTSTPNQDSPVLEGLLPILGLDVWEHAYYLNYQNRRPDYIAAFWQVVNWDVVDKLYVKAIQSDSSYLV